MVMSGCGGGSGSSQTTKAVTTSQTYTDPNGHLVGMWGAKDINAALQLTSTGGQFQELGSCGWGGPLNGPIIPDQGGHFDVSGTYLSNIPSMPVHYVGTVSGNTITLTVVENSSGTGMTYTLTYGQQPPQFTGVCPG